jgi:hypothetical protein
MTVSTPCERLAPHLGDLFTCAEVNGTTRIRTPYLYPDGGLIDLLLADGLHGETLTDFGETLGWLRTQSHAHRRTSRQRRLIDDICVTHNVELFKGSLMARVPSPDRLAAIATRLGQACLRVADLSLLLRTQGFSSVVDEVEEFLAEQPLRYERDEKLPGRSGRIWTIDFHTRAEARSTLVTVLATGTRGATSAIANRAVAPWFDLSHLKVGPEGLRFVSLVDDTVDVWSPEDIARVGELSDVALWSSPESVRALITGAD